MIANEEVGGKVYQSELGHLIDELVESELDFINDLRLCQEAYIEPLSRSFDVSNIFIKWDQLMQLHELAMRRISSLNCFKSDKRSTDEYRFIFEVFRDLLSSLVEVYTEVCSRQRESTRQFESLMVSDIRFKQLVSDCQRNTSRVLEKQLIDEDKLINSKELRRNKSRALSSIKLPLTNFMLKPMQRITKYSLIFDRILKIINKSGPKELENTLTSLKLSAQSLCERVNEACRLKEDNENNQSKLQWAQSHIKQQFSLQQQPQSSPSTVDLVSLESKHSISMSGVSQDSLRNKDNNLTPTSEYIVFDSKTNCLGDRKFIKSSSFFKLKSGKELVLFLFNDVLLLTQVKGTGSVLKVEDVFQSTRAQQAYYKLYRPPILVEDIILLDQATMTGDQELVNQMKRNSVTDLQSHFVITFSDKSNGSIYNLIPLNAQEKINWTRELSQRSTEAREARAEYQARQVAFIFKPLSRKPSVSECVARLFVTVLEVNQYHIRSRNSSIPSSSSVRGVNYSSLNLRTGSHNLLASTSKISIQIQLKRLKHSVNITCDDQSRETVNEGKDLVPMSDIFSTKSVAINPNTYSNDSSSLTDGNVPIIDNLVRFVDESTQFLIKKKSTGEYEDYIDIGLFDEGKFRETRLIARKRVNLDQLLQQQLQPNQLIDQPTDFMSTILPDQLDRPFESIFKMRLLRSLHDPLSNSSRQDMVDNRRSKQYRDSSTPLTSSMRESWRQSTGINIVMRFHLQLFRDTN